MSSSSFTNESEYRDKLNEVYQFARTAIVEHQNLISGLIPSWFHSEQTAGLKDTVYAAFALWALGEAYGKTSTTLGRMTEMHQTAVKMLRGVLTVWMRQSYKLEVFKSERSVDNSLASFVDIATGEALPLKPNSEIMVGFQQDVVALFLICLGNLTRSGLLVVWSYEEVCLVQNLVYYVERAYRVPDAGPWFRGSKYHNNTNELNASTLGLTKTALEACSDLDLFGANESPRSIIHVDSDAHYRNQTTCHTILPRESNSKSTDAALLATLCWPCAVSHEHSQTNQTLSHAVQTLERPHGFVRYVADSFRSPVVKNLHHQSSSMLEPGDLAVVTGHENEYPFFGFHLAINAALAGDQTKANDWLAKTESWTFACPKPGCFFRILPTFYLGGVKSEPAYKCPACGHSKNVTSVNQLTPFAWGYSLWLVARLVVSRLISPGDLDPCGVIFRTECPLPCRGPTPYQKVVQIVILAESLRLQQYLARFGIASQTPRQIEPVVLWNPSQLIDVYSKLGVCPQLGLSGRPARPIGCLGTGKFYRTTESLVLTHTLRFDVTDFYLFHDPESLIQEVQTDIKFLADRWDPKTSFRRARPTYAVILRETNFRRPSAAARIFQLLAEMRHGSVASVKCTVMRAQDAALGGVIDRLDFLAPPNGSLCDCTSADSSWWFQLCDPHVCCGLTTESSHKSRLASMECGGERESSSEGNRSRSNSQGVNGQPRTPRDRFRFFVDTGAVLPAEPPPYHFTSARPDRKHKCSLEKVRATSTVLEISKLWDSHCLNQTDPKWLLSLKVAMLQRLAELSALDSTFLPDHPEKHSHRHRNNSDDGSDDLHHDDKHPETVVQSFSAREHLAQVYSAACAHERWRLVRICAGLLRKIVDSIAPALTNLIVRGKHLSLGVFGKKEVFISNPMSPLQLYDCVLDACAGFPGDAMLSLELLLATDRLLWIRPELFDDLSCLRLPWIVKVLREMHTTSAFAHTSMGSRRPSFQKEMSPVQPIVSAFVPLDDMSPTQVANAFTLFLQMDGEDPSATDSVCPPSRRPSNDISRMFRRMRYTSNTFASSIPNNQSSPSLLAMSVISPKGESHHIHHQTSAHYPAHSATLDHITWRKRLGALHKVPKDFDLFVHRLLTRLPKGILINDVHISHFPELQDMDGTEPEWTNIVEQRLLSKCISPERRQLVVEALSVVHRIFERNPELDWSRERLDIDSIIVNAATTYEHDNPPNNPYSSVFHHDHHPEMEEEGVDSSLSADDIPVWLRLCHLQESGPHGSSAYLARATLGELKEHGVIDCPVM